MVPTLTNILILALAVIVATPANAVSDTPSSAETVKTIPIAVRKTVVSYETVGTKQQIRKARKELYAAEKAVAAARKALKKAIKKASRKNASYRANRAVKNARKVYRRAVARLEKASKKLKDLLTTKKIGTKGKVRVNGKYYPRSCPCAIRYGGHGKCYVYTRGKYCRARRCADSYVCVSKRKSKGLRCVLRILRSRITPVGYGKCKTKPILDYIYVPY